MDAATLDELRTLRARAYGPSADIDQDPAALQRLHELEAASSAPDAATPEEPAAVPDPEPVPAEPARESPLPQDVEEVLRGGAPASVEPDPVPARTRKRRRVSSPTVALWALSLVAVAALAAGLTYSFAAKPPVSASSGAPQIDTLEPDPFIEVPAGWFGAGASSLTFEYYGLTFFETPGGFGGNGTDCFSVIASDQMPEPGDDTNNWSMSGLYYSGCAVGAFPATVQFAVDSAVPQQLRDRLPPDSALQFVFDGGRIGVFLDSGE